MLQGKILYIFFTVALIHSYIVGIAFGNNNDSLITNIQFLSQVAILYDLDQCIPTQDRYTLRTSVVLHPGTEERRSALHIPACRRYFIQQTMLH